MSDAADGSNDDEGDGQDGEGQEEAEGDGEGSERVLDTFGFTIDSGDESSSTGGGAGRDEGEHSAGTTNRAGEGRDRGSEGGEGSSSAKAVEIGSDNEDTEVAVLYSGERSDPVDLDQNEHNAGTNNRVVVAAGFYDGTVVVAWPDQGHSRGEAVTITEGNMKRLAGRAYVEDSVVDIYLKYLHLHKLQELNGGVDPRSIFVCSNHLYTQLRAGAADPYAAKAVARWYKRVDICSKRYILVPINQGTRHWSLVLICNPGVMSDSELGQSGLGPAMLHFDSSFGLHEDNQVRVTLGGWLCSRWWAAVEAKERAEKAEKEARGSDGGDSDEENEAVLRGRNRQHADLLESIQVHKTSVMQQQNGVDCGVYVLMFAEELLKRLPTGLDGVLQRMRTEAVERKRAGREWQPGAPRCARLPAAERAHAHLSLLASLAAAVAAATLNRALPSAGGPHPAPSAQHAAPPAREHTMQPTRQYPRQGLGMSR